MINHYIKLLGREGVMTAIVVDGPSSIDKAVKKTKSIISNLSNRLIYFCS